MLGFLPAYGIVLEVDWEGNIVHSLHDPTGSVVMGASEVMERPGGKILLGSIHEPYLVEVELPE